MYHSFYKLRAKPFQNNTDPDFMWMGERRQKALSILEYGIHENRGCLLLTGDVGTGKTTLIQKIIRNLRDNYIIASLPDPGSSPRDFFFLLSQELGMSHEINSRSDFLLEFKPFLGEIHSQNNKLLIIIDEAQRLTHEILEEIRLLINFDPSPSRMMNVFFTGQNDLNTILNMPENRNILQRITVNCNLQPLTSADTASYIKHRLQVAGSDRDIFAADAISEVYEFSRGFPRQINILCDLSMLCGFTEQSKIITRKMVCNSESIISLPPDRKPEKAVTELEKNQNIKESEDNSRRSSKINTLFIVSLILTIAASFFIIYKGSSHLERFPVFISNTINSIANKISGTQPDVKPLKISEAMPKTVEKTQPPQISDTEKLQIPAVSGKTNTKPVAAPSKVNELQQTDDQEQKSPNLSEEFRPDALDITGLNKNPATFPEAEKPSIPVNSEKQLPSEYPGQENPRKHIEAPEVNKVASGNEPVQKTEDPVIQPEPTEIIDWILKNR